MTKKELHFQFCVSSIVVFAAVLLCSFSGFFYGLSKDSQTFMWAGGVVILVSLVIEGLVIYSLFSVKRKFTKHEKDKMAKEVQKRDQG